MPWDPRINAGSNSRSGYSYCSRAIRQHGKAAVHLPYPSPRIESGCRYGGHPWVRLLDRTARGVEPTMYGRALMKSGMLILMILDKALRR